MQTLQEGKFNPIHFEPVKSDKKVDFEFQQLGIEMQPLYGKAVWSLFYKHNLQKIKDADKICRQKGITTFPFLIGVLKRLK